MQAAGWQGRAWQPRPVPLPQPGAGQPRGTRAAPVLGTGHLCGDGLRARWHIRSWMRVRISPGEELWGQTQPWDGCPGPLHGVLWGSLPMDTSGKGLCCLCLGLRAAARSPGQGRMHSGPLKIYSIKALQNKRGNIVSGGTTQFITGFVITDM